MHSGSHAGAGYTPQNKGTTDTVSSHTQLSPGPSLSVLGVAGSSGIMYPLFLGSNNDNQVSPVLDASSDVQSDAMEDIIGSEHSPAATSNVSSDFIMEDSTSSGEGGSEGHGRPQNYRPTTPPSFFSTNTGDFTTLDRVDGVIDESLLDGDDDMDFDAQNAQKETEADETINGVLQEYMADILGRIKWQIESHGHPDCYANGTFWEHPKDPPFALQASATHATGVSPTELYHLDVFIWLPDRIPGFSSSFSCSYTHHRNLSHNGWNEKPIARQVKRLYRDYLLLTNCWICDKKQGGCGKSFQETDPYIISQLPHHFQEAFPAILAVHAAVDKQLISLMHTCFATCFGLEPFAALMQEMCYLDHAHRELLYLAAATLSAQFHHPRPFSKFTNKNCYAGTSPSTQYCRAVFVDWMHAYRPYFDRVIAALPATVVKGDHTFGSLQENVSHIVINPFEHLPLLLLPEEPKSTFYEDSDLIDAACDHLLSGTYASKTKLVVGFALCSMGRHDVPESGGVHMIQIATGGTVYIFKVTHFHSQASLPPNLLALIMSPLVIKVGEHIQRDLSHIASSWGLLELLKILQDPFDPHYIDLGHLAKLKGAVTSASTNLATITAAVLNHCMVQEDKFSNIDWSSPSLPDDAQEYRHEDFCMHQAHGYNK
ncbi:hypothetical protein PILCRDRAFT_3452 [Piloderma croceum F 1598]|uniref:DUF6729 domain-containing protein n=1 Tax=Piloderma croceum (strain F 1598) TaxID=765440 RepID=A0A0C3G9Q4_PILCF|nr:hypothetical protein PILCRDRAFT_3452 [Piloderma croceum F 1598]